MRQVFILILALLFSMALLCPAKSFAAFTGLNIIPVADVLAPGSYDIEFQNDGFFINAAVPTPPPAYCAILTEVGLLPGLEVGADINLTQDSNNPSLFNFKYQILQNETEHVPLLAIGVMNFHGSLANPTAYLVVSKELAMGRGHLGVGFTSNTATFDFANTAATYYFGFHRELNEWLAINADFSSGDANFASVGFFLQPWENVGFLLAYQRANNQNVMSDGYTFHMVVTESLFPESR